MPLRWSWHKTFGGSLDDGAVDIFERPDGTLLLVANAQSQDGMVSGNHSNSGDVWLVNLAFPGIPLYPTFSINANPDTLCAGHELVLRSTATRQGLLPAYEWYVNGSKIFARKDTLSLTTLNNGDSVYAVLTSSDACVTHPVIRSNIIRVAINPSVIPSINIVPTDSTICAGYPVTFTANTTHGGSAPVYQWYVNNHAAGTNTFTFTSSSFANNDSINCLLKTNAYCATDTLVISAPVVMSVGRMPVVSILKDTTVFLGDTFTLRPSITGPIQRYDWTPAAGLSNSHIVSPLAYPSTTTTYKLTVTSVNDCGVADASILVRVLKPIIVPNVFSPNGDGINDRWMIGNLGGYIGASVEIYDRYGHTVYKSKSEFTYWDGTLNGKPLPIGNYYYIVDPKNGVNRLTGSLTILK